MRRASAFVLMAVFVFAGVAAAQTPPAPKPGPEHQKLQFLVGNWKSEGNLKPNPFGPGGKFTTADHVEWMEGGFFLVWHSKGSGAMGNITTLAVMGYDSQEKVYTYDEFNSNGEVDHSKGTVDGDTWTWTSTSKMGDQTLRGRFTIKVVSPSAYTFKFELAAGEADYATVMEGKSTRTK